MNTCTCTYIEIHVHYSTGDVAFGKHGEGQLGRSAEGEGGGTGKGQEAEAWHLSPGLIPSLGDSCKVVWIGACSNQTFE